MIRFPSNQRIKNYQVVAAKTARLTDSFEEQMKNWVLGLIGEAGEIADIVKKYLYHGHDFDREKVVDEMSDLLWYFSMCHTTMDIDLIASFNGAKGDYWGKYDKVLDREQLYDGVVTLFTCANTISLNAQKNHWKKNKSFFHMFLIYYIKMCICFGIELEEIMDHNEAKLRARYPDGFSELASINRVN